ncbi:MAG TPA: DUF4012 domain-containing protein [Ktedonosporobacter sp.]|nr:DUF4012 domain-containing protein [Ktedonosporobacter sp.]
MRDPYRSQPHTSKKQFLSQLTITDQPSTTSIIENQETIPVPIAAKQPGRQEIPLTVTHRSRKHAKWQLPPRRLALLCCLGLLLLTSIGSIPIYLNYTAMYHRDMALAQSGLQHLQTSEGLLKTISQGSLDLQKITQARQEFSAAASNFSTLQNDLQSIPGVATLVPKYGSLLRSTLHIVPLAIELSQAGQIGCDALITLVTALHNPLDAGSKGLTMQDLTTIQQDMAKIQTILNTAAGQVNNLQPEDLQSDPRIASAATKFREALPAIKDGAQSLQTLMTLAPMLLGVSQPTNYLLELLDSTELRPGGGFIGNYGIATVTNGKLSGMHMQDVYLLDFTYEKSGHHIAQPPSYQWFTRYPATWSLRDSNLDADFPTTARYAEQIYNTEGKGVPVQGAIAITPWFIQNALTITGPIIVDEYHETITAQNLVNRIHYHQGFEEWDGGGTATASNDGHSSQRKRFTEILFEHFFTRLKQVAATNMPQIMHLMQDSLHSKDLQLYLNSNDGESVLQKYHLGSTIESPGGDSLFVVDANIGGNKANGFMNYTMQDEVTIEADGSVIHKTTLTYSWPFSQESQQNNYGGVTNKYWDYVRIYAPPGSKLLSQNGWVPNLSGEAFGRIAWSGFFGLNFGKSGTINLSWQVPGAATRDNSGWHYHYLVQKQAGITWQSSVEITLPSGTQLVGQSGGLTISNNMKLAIKQPLKTDLTLGVDYH